ncbi:MAG: hypothetical protein ACE5ED_03615 [Rhodothalassiaceae bacterium]
MRRIAEILATMILVTLVAGCTKEEARPLPGFFDTAADERITGVLAGEEALVFISALLDRGARAGEGGRYHGLSLYFSRAEPLRVASAAGVEEKTSFRTDGWQLRPYLLPPGTYSVRALAWEEPAKGGARRRVIEVTPYRPGDGTPELFAFTVKGGEVRNLGFLVARRDPDDVGGLYLRIEDNGGDVQAHIRRHHGRRVADDLLARLATRLPVVPPHIP